MRRSPEITIVLGTNEKLSLATQSGKHQTMMQEPSLAFHKMRSNTVFSAALSSKGHGSVSLDAHVTACDGVTCLLDSTLIDMTRNLLETQKRPPYVDTRLSPAMLTYANNAIAQYTQMLDQTVVGLEVREQYSNMECEEIWTQNARKH